MTALFAFDELRRCDHRRDDRDWLEAYRAAETEAELAQAAVRSACAAYTAKRDPATEEAYRVADRRYDAARFAFQRASFEIVGGIRAIVGIARAMELVGANVRML